MELEEPEELDDADADAAGAEQGSSGEDSEEEEEEAEAYKPDPRLAAAVAVRVPLRVPPQRTSGGPICLHVCSIASPARSSLLAALYSCCERRRHCCGEKALSLAQRCCTGDPLMRQDALHV